MQAMSHLRHNVRSNLSDSWRFFACISFCPHNIVGVDLRRLCAGITSRGRCVIFPGLFLVLGLQSQQSVDVGLDCGLVYFRLFELADFKPLEATRIGGTSNEEGAVS